jgi:hypothetical protein
MGYVGEPLLDGLRGRPKPAPIDDHTIYVERAVMAPDIAKVDADRDLNPGLPAWDFSNEVLRWLLHGNSLSPIRKTCSSYLPVLIWNRCNKLRLADQICEAKQTEEPEEVSVATLVACSWISRLVALIQWEVQGKEMRTIWPSPLGYCRGVELKASW